MTTKKTGMARGLTSYGDAGFSMFLRKAFIKAMGYSDDALERPIVGVVNTYSGYNACHRTVPDLIEAVKRGVMLAGALPVDFPTVSLHESFAYPTSMFLRNLMAMDTEEIIRAQPMDAVVMIGGCDKTVPAQLMAAASAGVPAIQLVTGPMLTGSHRGERVGACTDCRRFWARYRADEIDATEIAEVNDRLAPSAGTCSVMGTASTMALAVEALGMMLPGGAAIPAVLSERLRHAEATGAAAVRLARDGITPDRIMTERAFENALRVLLATGGSTNGIIHLTAMAGRLGIRIDLEGFDRMGRETPVLVDLKPSGRHYMEDLHDAGGLAAILRELRPLLHLDCPTVAGSTLGEAIDAAPGPWPQDVVRTLENPIHPEGGMAFLRGTLAPGGAIVKQSAASARLMRHTGRAVVFAGAADLAARIDDPDLDVTADDILVLQNIGPKGAPGMPEAGYLPIPRKLARQGVTDMVRISDGRMSGTASGTIVLHVTPESASGGPLALVRTGDRIRLDVPARRIDLLVDEAELAARTPVPVPHAPPARGYRKLYLDSVLQADEGCDFDFLRPAPTRTIPPRS
ncbi:dihydroxy-acid dehydratase [Skermanella sp. TT6]|uniref:Dihydroxy-acid dehydratase n=1 Tax=Skermanella cutis TaxID=2775420 RepID=A0ABX7B5C7_9PROT|nr:IlvD/Edd family dehydratase [Skermanella sp. TT6]QQP89329.1 dihydroxy-acid dehydratase [Skermanella sp. TT6]